MSDPGNGRQPRLGTFWPCAAFEYRGPDLIDSPPIRKGSLNLRLCYPAGAVPPRLTLAESEHEIGPSRFQDQR